MAKGDPFGVYIPEPYIGEDEDSPLVRWLVQELARVSASFELALARQVDVYSVVPEKPREGMIVGADGTNWNPGSGAGLYAYIGGTWIPAFEIGFGTVSSVGISGSNGITVGGSPITSAGTITLGLGAITPTSVAATGTVTGSNLSGTNTGDQTITLTGHVTGSGTGSFATTIANGVVVEGMQLLADVTTHDVSITKHGYVPKAPNDANKYLSGLGTWVSLPTAPNSWVPLVDGAEPPSLITDGAGQLIFVAYSP